MQLLAGNAHLLHHVLLLDSRAEHVGPIDFNEPLRLVVADVVDDQSPVVHLGHHPLVVVQRDALVLQPPQILVVDTGAILLRVGLDVQLLDVAAVGVDLDRGKHAAALVVVAMGEFVAGRHGADADLGQQFLVMMRPAAADEEHRRLPLAARPDFVLDLAHRGHFLGHDRLGPPDQLRVVEIPRDLAERLGRGRRPDEIHLEPGDAVFLLDHVGDVVDRPVAHDHVEVGGVGVLEALDAGIAAEGGHQGDAAALQQVFEHEGVAADVVFAEHAQAEAAGPHRVVSPDHVLEQLVVGDVVAG